MVVRHTVTWLATAVILLLLAAPLTADAQPTGKVYRIGFIVTATASETGHLVKALDEGLRELGYVEGRNIVFERRFAEGRQAPRAGRARSQQARAGLRRDGR
jgi:hypothetical protein